MCVAQCCICVDSVVFVLCLGHGCTCVYVAGCCMCCSYGPAEC